MTGRGYLERKLFDRLAQRRDEIFKKRKSLEKNKTASEFLKNLSKTSLTFAKLALSKAGTEKSEILKELKNTLNSDSLPKFNMKYMCKFCKDSGISSGQICRCFSNILKKEKFEIANQVIPLRFFNFQNFNLLFYSDKKLNNSCYSHREMMKKVVDFCSNYALNFGISSPSLLFVGETGLGKTHISLSVANMLIEKNFNVIYSSMPTMSASIEKERFGRQRSYFSEDDISNCDLLILDDLGSEFITNLSISVVYNVINLRTMRHLPTIISTNLSMKNFEDIYGPRVVSRIIGNFLRLEFVGVDIRQQKLKLSKKRGDNIVSF
ncbi:MAG: ATP-binding protein [Firmicutes bacterium]|nr:ATP-binding protein [Bacillota bacterium]